MIEATLGGNMTKLFASTLLYLASPVLMLIYWRNNMKKMDLEELRLMLSYEDMGSFYPER